LLRLKLNRKLLIKKVLIIMSRYKKINITKVASVLAVSALLSTTAYAGNNDSMIAFGAKVGTGRESVLKVEHP